ncbi:MAG TPA: endonuclease domain-containing protein [Rhodoblastus sp.]|nr:endonuclease domain-containing protein [Rhodoblastus sp.]
MSVAKARSLRKAMTSQEVKLWLRLRALRPQGLHFRRQVPRGRYVVDFACLRSMVAVEVDGFQHGLEAGQATDAARDLYLGELGFLVLRFWNHEIDRQMDSVVETIFARASGRIGEMVRHRANHAKHE